MVRVALFLLAFGSSLLSGWGTFFDAMAGPADNHLYYRGARFDIAAARDGMPLLGLDLPFSALVDTLLVPSIAFRQMTDPAGAKHKSVFQAAQEGLANSVSKEVILPVAAEVMKAEAEAQAQQPAPATPQAHPKVPPLQQ